MAAQAGLCLAWSETPEDRLSRDKAHLYSFPHSAKKVQNESVISYLFSSMSVSAGPAEFE